MQPSKDDQRTVSLSEDGHAKLVQMKERGLFAEMLDAYRMALSVALAEGLIDAAGSKRTRTYLNAGSLDPDGVIRDVLVEMFDPGEGSPYEIAERLAEAGIHALWDRIERNPDVGSYFQEEQAELTALSGDTA